MKQSLRPHPPPIAKQREVVLAEQSDAEMIVVDAAPIDPPGLSANPKEGEPLLPKAAPLLVEQIRPVEERQKRTFPVRRVCPAQGDLTEPHIDFPCAPFSDDSEHASRDNVAYILMYLDGLMRARGKFDQVTLNSNIPLDQLYLPGLMKPIDLELTHHPGARCATNIEETRTVLTQVGEMRHFSKECTSLPGANEWDLMGAYLLSGFAPTLLEGATYREKYFKGDNVERTPIEVTAHSKHYETLPAMADKKQILLGGSTCAFLAWSPTCSKTKVGVSLASFIQKFYDGFSSIEDRTVSVAWCANIANPACGFIEKGWRKHYFNTDWEGPPVRGTDDELVVVIANGNDIARKGYTEHGKSYNSWRIRMTDEVEKQYTDFAKMCATSQHCYVICGADQDTWKIPDGYNRLVSRVRQIFTNHGVYWMSTEDALIRQRVSIDADFDNWHFHVKQWPEVTQNLMDAMFDYCFVRPLYVTDHRARGNMFQSGTWGWRVVPDSKELAHWSGDRDSGGLLKKEPKWLYWFYEARYNTLYEMPVWAGDDTERINTIQEEIGLEAEGLPQSDAKGLPPLGGAPDASAASDSSSSTTVDASSPNAAPASAAVPR